MKRQLLGLLTATEGCDDTGPEHPGGTQACNLDEEGGTDRKGELHAWRNQIDAQTLGLHGPQVRDAGRQGACEILHCA